ncbi:MAG: Bro-N domain-containing protein [Oscillospiraceae bacterium]|nr:Bro-N domain-containing protein [Oscillospiraceae bacterium]
MSESKDRIKVFEEKHVRTVWDEEAEKWWFSIVDVIGVLTEQSTQRGASNYWAKMKERLVKEGASELLTNCQQFRLRAPDGKMRLTDVADTEQILRLIQSVPSPKAEPFKMWLAKVGSERIDETVDPEQSIERAIENYRRLGYSENWINQRIKSIEVRKALTDEWDISGVEPGKEYAALTDLMTKTWSGMTTHEYKKHKDLKKENLRDNMTNTELVLNMLAEVAATDISIARQPSGFAESAKVAKEGAETAKIAREQLEQRTGKPAVSSLNAKDLGKRRLQGAKDGDG